MFIVFCVWSLVFCFVLDSDAANVNPNQTKINMEDGRIKMLEILKKRYFYLSAKYNCTTSNLTSTVSKCNSLRNVINRTEERIKAQKQHTAILTEQQFFDKPQNLLYEDTSDDQHKSFNISQEKINREISTENYSTTKMKIKPRFYMTNSTTFILASTTQTLNKSSNDTLSNTTPAVSTLLYDKTKPNKKVTKNTTISARTSPLPPTTLVTTSTTKSANSRTRPITLRIVPDVTEIIAMEGEIPHITCGVDGTNLRKLLPFTLSWYQRENAGKDVEVNFERNKRRVAFHKTLTNHDFGHEIYCALKFNKLAPTVFGLMSSPYIKISRKIKSTNNNGYDSENDEEDSQNWIIGGVVGTVTFFIIAALATLYVKRRIASSNINNRPPEFPPSRSSGVYEMPDDPIYSYVPISVVTMYEAKAMAAGNRKAEMLSVKPPPLPERPPGARTEDYDYA